MSWLYFAGSILGVALVILVNRLLGGYEPTLLEGPEDIARALERDNQPLGSWSLAAIDREGRAGLLLDPDSGLLGVAEAMGDSLVSRRLGAGQIAGFEWRGGEGDELVLRFRDFTLPRLILRPATAVDCEELTAGLEALLQKTENGRHD